MNGLKTTNECRKPTTEKMLQSGLFENDLGNLC